VAIVTDAASPRWVTGIPAAAGAARAELTPGTISKRIPAATSDNASSPPATEHERVATLESNDPSSESPKIHQKLVDFVLGGGTRVAWQFANVI
jgi:hypothetical protein